MSPEEIAALTQRVKNLETMLAEHRALLMRLIDVPAVKMTFAGYHPILSPLATPAPEEKKAAPVESKVHPYSQSIQDGAKLKNLAWELSR